MLYGDRLCHVSGSYCLSLIAQAQVQSQVSPRDLWYFIFPLSATFHQCSILNHFLPTIHNLRDQQFIHSFRCHVQNVTFPCRSQELFPFLLYNFSCHPSPPTILPSSLTSSCHLFLGLPLNILFPNSYIILYGEFNFVPLSVHAQTNVIYLILLSLL